MEAADPGTTIMVVSDHGFKTGAGRPQNVLPYTTEQPVEWHRENGIFILSGPGARPGPLAPRATLFDIAPTLLDIAGIAAPNSYQGTSAIDDNRRMATFFADYSLRLLGLRDGAMKYIRELDSGRSQLFDLRADPGETRNVADRYPDDVRWYAQKLNEWMK